MTPKMRTPLYENEPGTEPKPGGGGPPQGEFTENQRLLEEMRELREAMKKGQEKAPPPQATPPQPQPGITREQMEESFWKDPLNTSAAISRYATHEAMRQFEQGLRPSMQALEEIAKQEARKISPDTFDKYSAEIEAKMSLVPAQFRSNPQTWKNAFHAVRGEHFEDITKDMKAAPPGTTDGPGTATPRRSPTHKPGSSLTEEELYVANKLKLTPEAYEHGKQLVNNQASAWNTVFTFETGQSGVRERAS